MPDRTLPGPSLWEIFFTWLSLGIQSFGGGSSTFILIHQTCIQRGWLDEPAFVRTWALAQIAPGINLLKLTIMVGHKLRGWPGLLAAAGGLMLPSATLTVLMTAGFEVIRGQPLVQAAMRGILPATIGLSLAMAVQMAQPLVTRAYHEGLPRLAAHLIILTGAGLLLGLDLASPVVVLLLSGGITILALSVVPVKASPVAEEGAP